MQFHSVIPVLLVLVFKTTADLPACYRDAGLSRQRRLEGTKLEILQRLGLEREPSNPTYEMDPSFLEDYELVQKSWELSDVQKPPCASLDFRTMDILPYHPVAVGKKKRLGKIAHNTECPNDLSEDFYDIYTIKFNIDLREKDFVTDAQLWLKKSRLSTWTENRILMADQVDLKFVTMPDNYYGEVYNRYVATQHLHPDSITDLLTFNVTKAIEWWLGFNSKNRTNEIDFEIHIRCSRTLPGGTGFIPNFQFFNKSDQDAGLVITAGKYNSAIVPPIPEATASKKRRKRTSHNNNNGLKFCKPNQFECCLMEMEIDFHRDLNWTWVVKPKKIAFNYCSGECPRRTTRHSQLLDLFRAKVQKNPVAAAEPCCVPNRFRSIPLATFLDGESTMVALEDIVAISCACR